jgi:hypothetical protein
MSTRVVQHSSRHGICQWRRRFSRVIHQAAFFMHMSEEVEKMSLFHKVTTSYNLKSLLPKIIFEGTSFTA